MFSVTQKNLETWQTPPAPAVPFREAKESLVPGQKNVWYEYVPTGYTGEWPVPLVVELHGGNSDPRDFISYVPWYIPAEQYGFIVVYPTSQGYLHWDCDEKDVTFLYRLIERMKEKYSIDASRVYMQGMSNGDMMTLAFAAHHPEMLAAAGYMTGPTFTDRFPAALAGELPALQMRGEKDVLAMGGSDETDPYTLREKYNDENRHAWMERNRVEGIPQISICGKDNYVLYTGHNGDILYWEIGDMGHRVLPHMPSFFWERFYTGFRRTEEGIVRYAPLRPMEPDGEAFALACGSTRMYRNGQVFPIDDAPNARPRYLLNSACDRESVQAKIGEMWTTPVLMVPIGVLERLGARVTADGYTGNARAELADGRVVMFYGRSLLYSVDGQYASFKRQSAHISGCFYIPLREVMEEIFGWCCCEVNEVFYAAPHPIQLTRGTARIIHELLDEDPAGERFSL